MLFFYSTALFVLVMFLGYIYIVSSTESRWNALVSTGFAGMLIIALMVVAGINGIGEYQLQARIPFFYFFSCAWFFMLAANMFSDAWFRIIFGAIATLSLLTSHVLEVIVICSFGASWFLVAVILSMLLMTVPFIATMFPFLEKIWALIGMVGIVFSVIGLNADLPAGLLYIMMWCFIIYAASRSFSARVFVIPYIALLLFAPFIDISMEYFKQAAANSSPSRERHHSFDDDVRGRGY